MTTITERLTQLKDNSGPDCTQVFEVQFPKPQQCSSILCSMSIACTRPEQVCKMQETAMSSRNEQQLYAAMWDCIRLAALGFVQQPAATS